MSVVSYALGKHMCSCMQVTNDESVGINCIIN